MKNVLIIHSGAGDSASTLQFIGQTIEMIRIGCDGDPQRARDLILEHDGQFAAIGLEGLPVNLELGPAQRRYHATADLLSLATTTPVVDGSGIRAGLERWGVVLAERAEPGIFSRKRVLMVPGLNHTGLAQSLGRRAEGLRYADPAVYFGVPDLPGVGTRFTLAQAAPPTLDRLRHLPLDRLYGSPGDGDNRHAAAFRWADVLAGDAASIRRLAPERLAHKTIVVESMTPADEDDFRRRGASILVGLLPEPGGIDADIRWSSATVEALLAALRPNPTEPISEDTYLDLMAEIDWQPSIRYLKPEEHGVNRFAFVIHPLSLRFIHRHPPFAWTRVLPDRLVEAVAAFMPPMYISTIRGGVSPATGQRIEGDLISLGATPREMMRHGPRFTYRLLNQAARTAERRGARIMGLGAFTSVVGDAGATVAHEAGIAVTSGNSLTVAATLEAAKQAMIKMGKEDLTRGRAMVIGATGSIGSVCARLLALAIREVVLVSIEPEKLIDLKRTIEGEVPGAQVTIATRAGKLVSDCDLVVTATSAFGQRILDITQCKPGAVICDVARPTDISEADAALRPDVLVIESGEVIIPGDEVDVGYDIGLPKGTVYACLGETALLAMEGRFESYTLGRQLDLDRVKEMYRLFRKHGFELGGLRSFDRFVTDEELAEKRRLADQLRADPEELDRYRREAHERLLQIPAMAKGIEVGKRDAKTWIWGAAAAGAAAFYLARRRRRPRRKPPSPKTQERR